MKVKRVLWLDDYRDPNSKCVYSGFFYTWIEMYSPFGDEKVDVVWVKTYDEFVDYIKENSLPDAICFDNDLGEDKEGYDCAKWLVEYCMDNQCELPKYVVQSANVTAHENINKLFSNFNKFQNGYN